MRVHELAAELGWTSRQLIAELCRRGEYVTSAASALEAPVVRNIRRDFAVLSEKPDRDASVAADTYGNSAERRVHEVVSVVYQFLEIPELDDRLSTTSMKTFADTPMWNRSNAILSWRYYLGETYCGPDDENVSIYAAPARATDLSGLPPTYLCTMELDPLRDEGINYAVGLLDAGVSVELHSFPGTFHGSAMIATAEVSKRGHAEALNALRRGLRAPTQSS
jgi:acetyl esterase/lipase